jgi:hypothetical protein
LAERDGPRGKGDPETNRCEIFNFSGFFSTPRAGDEACIYSTFIFVAKLGGIEWIASDERGNELPACSTPGMSASCAMLPDATMP